MKLKNSGQKKSQGTLLASNADGGLGNMKANETQHAKYEVVHTRSKLKIVTFSLLARTPLFRSEKHVLAASHYLVILGLSQH